MFGNNTVTSSWANPQSTPQSTPSAFGQPSTFGSTGFGSSTFGQPQQQPLQANPMFGNLTAPAATTTTGATPAPGFGAFSGGTSTFGGAKPATGFGAFSGGNATFGSGGAFSGGTGATSGSNTSGSLFGQASNTGTSTFGSGGGLFGAAKPATAFGLAATNTSGSMDNVTPVTTGTSTPYVVYTEKEGTNTLQYQSITAMPVYRGTSLEELRIQDYQQGRKTAGGFGQSATFGTTPIAGGIFGQTAQLNPTQPAGSLFGTGGTFGNPAPAANPLGAATGTGAFGTFGQPAATQPTQPAGTLFGNTFGQPQTQQPQPATGFGAFGTTQPQAAAGGFGGSTFGAQPKPAFGLGSTFGSGTSTFGQPQQQPASGLFGQTQPQQPAANTTFGGGLFGNKPSLFGGNPQPAAQPAQGFGLFGAAQQQQQPQPAPLFGGGSLFGQNQQQPQPQQLGGLGQFGQQQQQQQQQPQQPQPNALGGGLFGNLQSNQQQQQPFSNPAGGLFGNNQQQPNQQQQQPGGFTLGGGLFGNNQQQAQPATAGFNAFNNNGNKPAGSLFGNIGGNLGQQNQQQQSAGGTGNFGGLFGNRPNPPQLGTAPSAQMGGPPGGNIFGNSLGLGSFTGSTAQPGQGTLTASISQPIAHNLPIFAMLPPGPQSIDLTPRRKPTVWKDIPTRDPVPSFGLTYRPLQVQPRGYALLPAAEASKIFFSDGKPGALDLTKITEKRPPSVLGPDLFFGKSAADALAASTKPSVKKLVLTKKVDPSELYKKITNPNFKHSVSFSPALGMAVREREAALQLRKIGSTATVKTPSKSDAKDKDAPSKPVDPSELDEGEYWSKPDLDTLKGLDTAALSSLKDLVVGRAGYGEIHFLEPVDLTGVSKLGTLLGKIIRFDDRECSVYPDFDDEDKPPIGTGLNVKARIILVRCWTLDKATREPIKDEKHPAAIKHLKKLKNMKDTTFEGFDIVEGKWTFTVEHF